MTQVPNDPNPVPLLRPSKPPVFDLLVSRARFSLSRPQDENQDSSLGPAFSIFSLLLAAVPPSFPVLNGLAPAVS